MFFEGEENSSLKTWWDGLYSGIKNALDAAQIQIDAFNAGILGAIDDGKIKESKESALVDHFEAYFKNLIKKEIEKCDNEKKKGNTYMGRLQDIGFGLNKQNSITFTNNANDVYLLVLEAYKKGYNYYLNAEYLEKKKIEKLYTCESFSQEE